MLEAVLGSCLARLGEFVEAGDRRQWSKGIEDFHNKEGRLYHRQLHCFDKLQGGGCQALRGNPGGIYPPPPPVLGIGCCRYSQNVLWPLGFEPAASAFDER
jgi:hypothetical protein